jgi:hypothetical protein
MNDTETTDVNESENANDGLFAFINHALNKCMPILLTGFILFHFFGFLTWQPYMIIVLFLFASNYNFKCGYAYKAIEDEEDLDT